MASPDVFAKLTQALSEQAHPSIKASEFREFVTRISNDEEFASAFCPQLISLATFRRVERLASEELYDALFEGMEVADLPKATIEWYKAVRKDFIRLLDCDGVRLPAKALHLSTDFESLFASANVVTDVRPVFDGDRSSLVGAVVVQTLRVHYVGNGRGHTSGELSLALDADDIEKLIDELKKAAMKADTAKREFGEKLGADIFVVGEETYGFG
ncbi:MAG: hypothetical protein AAFX45_10695 [Pseudomonadota bacterium]